MDHPFSRKFIRERFLVSFLLVAAVLLCAATAHAYFTTHARVYTADGTQYARIGTRLDLLFDQIDPDTVSQGTSIGTGTAYDPAASWGSAANPYVISHFRHLQNLSVLQKVGYFYTNYIQKNYDGNGDYTGEGIMPWFLVCTPEGTPVTIDGCGISVDPVGDDQYPFVGFVGGAFTAGSTDVGGKASDVSAIRDVVVKASSDVIDVGLFGQIGYLGNESGTGSFSGAVSTVQNLLLYDVQISVNSPSPGQTIVGAVHRFLRSYVSGENASAVPEEDHHIGILAGHVEYANIRLISVYYSNDSVSAMNVSHSGANYLSSTGIIGFLHCMNPNVSSGTVGAGSGLNSSNISINGSAGSGGGLLSGSGRGYMSARDVADEYHWIKNAEDGSLVELPLLGSDPSSDITLVNAVNSEGKALCTEWVRKQLLWGTQATGRYYFFDGVFTFALSNTADSLVDTWDAVDDPENPGTLKPNPDSFFVGDNSDDAWKKNTTKGNRAVTAFIKPVTSSEQLNTVVATGKPILVMHRDEQNGRNFLLTLSDPSGTIDGGWLATNTSYTANGTWLSVADPDTIQSVFDSFNDGHGEPSITDNGLIVDRNGDGIFDDLGDRVEMLNLGSSGEADILNSLRTRYNVRIQYNQKNTLYRYFDADNPAYIDGSGLRTASRAEEYYYYTHSSTTIITTRHDFSFFQKTSAEETNIGSTSWNSNGSWRPDGFTEKLSDNQVSMEGTYNETTLPLFYVKGDTYYYTEGNNTEGGTPAQTDPDGVPLIPGTDVHQTYLKYNLTEDRYYLCDGDTSTPISSDAVTVTTDAETGKVTYTYNGVSYSPEDRTLVFEEQMNYYTLQDSNNANTLYMIMVKPNILTPAAYSIWCGQNPTGSGAKGATEKAFIKFSGNTADPYCTIRYSYGTEKRFVNFNTDNFNGQSNDTLESAHLYIYTLEATFDVDYGHITFEPRQNALEYSAGDYILWPSNVLSGNETISTKNATYSVKSLDDLYSADNGWRNHKGSPISSKDLTKKFHMDSQIAWGIFGSQWVITIGDRNLATPGFVVAPVGSNGVEANIPQGSIAFRINKAGESKIRVIVALPQSDMSKEERIAAGNQKSLSDAYFGYWKVEANGESILSSFSQDSAVEKILIPKSEPFSPATTAAQADYCLITTENGTKRLYPNGSRILVAYTFTVQEEGVYILGTTGQPMEIVFFSADGAASNGWDGVSGSILGNIDFVYDYGGSVITVNRAAPTGTDTRDYRYYYASHCLLYTDNSAKDAEGNFPKINNFRIQTRRFIHNSAGKSMNIQVSGQNSYVVLAPYTANADKINP